MNRKVSRREAGGDAVKCRSGSRDTLYAVTVAVQCIEVSKVTILQMPLRVEALNARKVRLLNVSKS